MDKDDKKQDVALIKKAMKQHDEQKHKGSGATTLKLKKGGVTNADLKKYGRNLARAMNQKSSGRGR